MLDWGEPDKEPHRELLDWHRSLIALRRAIPDLNDPRLSETRVETREDGEYRLVTIRRGRIRLVANLADRSAEIATPASRLVLASDQDVKLETDSSGDSSTSLLSLPAASAAVLWCPFRG
ncbi:DUF3459 domain-containing protein [Actinomadura sp. CNU-125]|uniref:DUF3459 domain-containing protein n=1 Tax=Actinomadura sp. CNU-125 TaxID=1904961 RepID=UPI002916F9E7|nr:DUF3459 domain-containing protein [Actinomadura sp. CNU-125]